MTTLTGSVERVVFRNPENGFCVARFREANERSDGETTIVGLLPALIPGETLRLEGNWQVHRIHGRNFRVERFEADLPDTRDGIELFLGSGAIKGIGPVIAKRILETFGDDTIKILDESPERLTSVPGVTLKRQQTIRRSWEEQKRMRELAIFLQEHGITVGLAQRILEVYGERAKEIIREDPYRLAQDVHGVGFRTADEVAIKLGTPRDSLSRHVAGLKHVLSEASDDGHVFVWRRELLDRGARILQARRYDLEVALLELLRRRDAVAEDEAIYLTALHRAESEAAAMIATLLSTDPVATASRALDTRAIVAKATAEQGLELAERQVQAAERALREKVSVLTGGPGTGKTSTLRTIIMGLERAGVSFCLCAPTGRAAKRVTETTGRPASTIHRLLAFQPNTGGFAHGADRPLEYDFVVVDEVSMLDTALFYHLLEAIPPEAHLVLVGDSDQLPSVGPGSVLSDLIESGVVATTRLTELFRQARGSAIVLAAHAVNRGEMPNLESRSKGDFFFVEVGSDEEALLAVKRLVSERIPSVFKLDPIDDIQVLSPMHRGMVGVAQLNTELQSLLNPRAATPAGDEGELVRGSRLFRTGDKVMQIKNNYDTEVYNGDIGKVLSVDGREQSLVVGFSNGFELEEVEYSFADLDELVLAYAASVHKAQRSEFPAVVMPVVAGHSIMLRRNLLYTAITRAQHLCVLVGSKRALNGAIAGDSGRERNTGLARKLRESISPSQPELTEPAMQAV